MFVFNRWKGCSPPFAPANWIRMQKHSLYFAALCWAVFFVGLAAVVWIGGGYLGSNPLGAAVAIAIGAGYLVGAFELLRYRQAVPGPKVTSSRDDSRELTEFPARLTICNTRKHSMTFGVAHIQPVVALIAGILILIMPRLLNYIIAIYLIFVGIVGLGIIR